MQISLNDRRRHLRLLGSPSQSVGAWEISAFRSAMAKGLLYYLAVGGKTQQRLTLGTLFWPEVDTGHAALSVGDRVIVAGRGDTTSVWN